MRNINLSAMQHICNISSDGNVVFYCMEDYLVFITIFFKYCRDFGVRASSLCVMRNHFHFTARFDSAKTISKLVTQVCSNFVQRYNSRPDKVKIRFKTDYSISSKWDDKSIRSCIIYVANNPVEKMQCQSAEGYRWNLPCYFADRMQSSKALSSTRADKLMEMAHAVVDSTFNLGKYLKYDQLKAIMAPLTSEGREQLREYIVNKYSNMDDAEILLRFGSIDNIITTSKQLKGNDYSIKDDVRRENYTHYDQMDEVLGKYGLSGNDIIIRDLPDNRFHKLVQYLTRTTDANPFEMSRYLHREVVGY